VGAGARAKSDAAFATTRLREAEAMTSLKNQTITKLRKELEKERQRADFNEKEVLR
jgi:hypothetical protein